MIFRPRRVFTTRGDKAAALVPLVGLRPNAAAPLGSIMTFGRAGSAGALTESSCLAIFLLATWNRKPLIGCEGHVNKARGGTPFAIYLGRPPLRQAARLRFYFGRPASRTQRRAHNATHRRSHGHLTVAPRVQ